MKILLTGASGQLGQEIQSTKPANVELITRTHQQLDITQADKVHTLIAELQPDCIINASAYTAVDDAETQKTLAFAVNALGPAHLAQAAYIHDARMIHISTDYVFDGFSGKPYSPSDLPKPLSCYGMSKLEGEEKVLEALKEQALIIRTTWVYSCYGKNFVKAMLQYFKQREQITMVADQIATPTWANILAQAIWRAVQKPKLHGIYHWTDAGVASKYDFAVAIQEEAVNLNLINRAIPILPIKNEEFPTPAKRPLYAVLDKTSSWRDFEIQPIHWRVALRQMLAELKLNSFSHLEESRVRGNA